MISLTARQVSQRQPMLRMRVSMSCWGIAANSSCNANRSSRIVTGGKVRAAKRLPRKSHTSSMGLRSEIVPPNPYVQYPHSLRAVRQLLCDGMVHCRP
ncbi:hypothetical protein TNCV_2510741 [Trichonephila clavipes]|nr:hypothetical protein TNCV_2510741 [Trichonephila clavipes]